MMLMMEDLQEMVRKRRYGRCQKAMGDTALLAGSPADAVDHYNTAVELCRLTNDLVWTSAALEGLAHAKVCHCFIIISLLMRLDWMAVCCREYRILCEQMSSSLNKAEVVSSINMSILNIFPVQVDCDSLS